MTQQLLKAELGRNVQIESILVFCLCLSSRDTGSDCNTTVLLTSSRTTTQTRTTSPVPSPGKFRCGEKRRRRLLDSLHATLWGCIIFSSNAPFSLRPIVHHLLQSLHEFHHAASTCLAGSVVILLRSPAGGCWDCQSHYRRIWPW